MLIRLAQQLRRLTVLRRQVRPRPRLVMPIRLARLLRLLTLHPRRRAAAPAAGGGGGAASGLFRAFGRVAEGEAQGKARSWGGAIGRYMPFGSRSETTTIERAPIPRPVAPFDNAAPPAGAVPEGADPFGAPSASPSGAPAGGADPFGAPPAAGDADEMKKEAKGDPFADDPVQPGESKSVDNPFEEKR